MHPKSTLLHLKGTFLHHGDPFDAFRRLLTPSRALFGESTDLCSTTLIHFSLAQLAPAKNTRDSFRDLGEAGPNVTRRDLGTRP